MSIVRGKTPPKMSRTEASSTPSIDGSIPDGECNFVSTSADTKTFACSKKTATEEWLDSMSISDISSRIWRRASTGNTVEGLDGTLYLTPESIEQKSSQLRKAPSNDAKSTSTEGFRDYPAPLSDSSEPSSPFISIEGSSLGREALRGSLATAFDSRGPEKRDGLNEITNWFLQWLEKGFKSCGSEQGTSSGAHPRASSGEGAISNRQGPRGLRKRGRNNSDPDDNNGESDDDDGDDKNPKKKPFFQRPIRRFGCPFFKYDPLTHCEYPSCMGRGFPDVHRVK